MNWVDLLAILPYFLSLVLAEVITETSDRGSEEVNRMGKILTDRVIRMIFRSFRNFPTLLTSSDPRAELSVMTSARTRLRK